MKDLIERLPTVLRAVDGKEQHRDYKRVVELSRDYYRPLITGRGIGHLLKRFNRREDEEAYKQRLLLTQVITPSIHNTIMGPLRKVSSVKPTVDRADFGPQAKTDNEELARLVQDFYAGKNVDHYLGSVLLDQGAIDPNAFCLIGFDEFDPRTEKPSVYPTVISSEDAWNFGYRNGELEWLLVHRSIKYKTKEAPAPTTGKKKSASGEAPKTVEKDGHWFCAYLKDHQVAFTQVDPATQSFTIEHVLVDAKGRPMPEDLSGLVLGDGADYFYRVSSNEVYRVRFYDQKSGMVQAFRIGFVPDPETMGRTCVNFWHAALPYMLKGIKAGSELDLTAALHAFLQKLQYANPCKGFVDEAGHKWDCHNGYEAGSTNLCKKCGGSGWDVITTAQDHITMRLPRTKEEFLDLANLVHYVPLPVEVLTWQDGYVDKLEAKCYRAVYNTERFRQDQVQATATGEMIDLQSVYDAIRPCVHWWSQSRVRIYRLAATFVMGSEKTKTLVVAHSMPRNLRYETTADMVALRKSMKEAGLSGGMLMQVDSDLLEHLYVDDQQALKRARTMLAFDPFGGKDEATCMQLISQDLTTRRVKVFWANMAFVFVEAEGRAAADGKDFYELSRTLQQKYIDVVVDAIMEGIDEDAQDGVERARLGVGDGNDPNGDGTVEPPPNDQPNDQPNDANNELTNTGDQP